MLNININSLSNSPTFSYSSNEWAHDNYLERDDAESIDAAIRRLIPDDDESDSYRSFARSSQQIEAFIRAFHRLEPGDDIDYSLLMEGGPTALDADDFYDQVQEFEESHFRKYNSPGCDHRTDECSAREACPEEDCEAWDEWQDEMADAVEEESSWAIELITYLELSRAAKMWAGLRSSLVVGELCNFHDEQGRCLVALYLGGLEVLVDGRVINIAVDADKIEERLSSQSLAA